jgi:hypothetical protein
MCDAAHPSQPAVCRRPFSHRAAGTEHVGNCTCGTLFIWAAGTEAEPPAQLIELAAQLSTTADWLRQDFSATLAGDMADTVYLAWQIIDEMAHGFQASRPGDKT